MIGEGIRYKKAMAQPTERQMVKCTSKLKGLLARKSVTQRELLTHIGRTRHTASVYKPLAALPETWKSGLTQ